MLLLREWSRREREVSGCGRVPSARRPLPPSLPPASLCSRVAWRGRRGVRGGVGEGRGECVSLWLPPSLRGVPPALVRAGLGLLGPGVPPAHLPPKLPGCARTPYASPADPWLCLFLPSSGCTPIPGCTLLRLSPKLSGHTLWSLSPQNPVSDLLCLHP